MSGDNFEAINKAVKDIGDTFAEFKATLAEKTKAEIKGYIDPLISEKLDRINDAITLAEDAKEAAEVAQKLIKAQRVTASAISEGVIINGKHVKSSDEVKGAVAKYLRVGENGLDEKDKSILLTHTKALSSGSDPAGGYAVLPEMDTAITRILLETSPIRQYATVKTISTDQYEKLQRIDMAGCGWADRDGAPSQTTTPTFNKLSIKAWKEYAEPAISQDLIDDSFIDIETELTLAVTDALTIQENNAFVVGDGNGMPRGFLTWPAGDWSGNPNQPAWKTIQQVHSGASGALTYGGLIDLVYSLKDGYHQRAIFMANRLAVASLRKITNTLGDPLWQPGFSNEPSTFLGYPIVRAADLPPVSAGALPLVFGDFSRGYIIIDRLGTRVLRDPYTQKPFVLYYTTRRVGGNVDNFEALKIQVIAA